MSFKDGFGANHLFIRSYVYYKGLKELKISSILYNLTLNVLVQITNDCIYPLYFIMNSYITYSHTMRIN
jgi:hypothetical protein